MRVICIVSDVPCPRHDRPGVTAVNVMLHELLSALSKKGHHLTLLPIFNRFRKTEGLTDDEQQRFADYERDGLKVINPVFPDRFVPKVGTSFGSRACRAARRFLVPPAVGDFYPAVRAQNLVIPLLKEEKPDAVLTVWSADGVAATHDYSDAPRIAYHGDVDPHVTAARFSAPALFDGVESYPFWTKMNRRREVSALETAHWNLMRRVSVIANITANNAAYYTRMGHPRSMYARNTWINSQRPSAPSMPARGPLKIVGHFGYLDRTGSTFGLNFLLATLPELEKELAGVDFEVHVIGGGQPAPGIRSRLNHPRLRVRGYVPDLDSELTGAAAVMMLNNAGPYQAAFTRHIVSWSLGACLITHDHSRRAIPEIEDGKNALTGASPAEVAKAVKRAVADAALNESLRNEGRATYEKFFRPDIVAGTLDVEIKRSVQER